MIFVTVQNNLHRRMNVCIIVFVSMCDCVKKTDTDKDAEGVK